MLSNSHARSGLSFGNGAPVRMAGKPGPAWHWQTPIGAWFRHFVSGIRQWQARRRAAKELSELDDRDLRDIGLTRFDVRCLSRKDPFFHEDPWLDVGLH